MNETRRPDLDRYYTFGDVYETIDTVDELDNKLSRLQRMHLLTEEEVLENKGKVAEIRENLETHLPPD
jgi:hypothetical protein